jgi:hypothetical protein
MPGLFVIAEQKQVVNCPCTLLASRTSTTASGSHSLRARMAGQGARCGWNTQLAGRGADTNGVTLGDPSRARPQLASSASSYDKTHPECWPPPSKPVRLRARGALEAAMAAIARARPFVERPRGADGACVNGGQGPLGARGSGPGGVGGDRHGHKSRANATRTCQCAAACGAECVRAGERTGYCRLRGVSCGPPASRRAARHARPARRRKGHNR